MLEPYAGTDIQVDNDSGVSYDTIDFYEYAGLPTIANELIEKIGIKVPLPIVDEDSRDSNAD